MSKRAGESIAVPFAPGMGMPVAGTAAPEAATAEDVYKRQDPDSYSSLQIHLPSLLSLLRFSLHLIQESRT